MNPHIRVLCIAPYDGMKSLMAGLAEEYPQFDLSLFVGDREHGLEIAKSNFHGNYDVVISRGGTADMLRQNLSIPVVEIETSMYDILYALKLTDGLTGKAAMVSTGSIAKNARRLCDLMGYDLDIFIYESNEDMENILLNLQKERYQAILGDMVANTTAQRLASNISASVASFYLSPMGEDTADAAEEKLTAWLLERFDKDEDAFSVSDSSALEDAMSEVTGMLELLLGGIAAISLVVGGIGIMNIMLVSVTERTREIGIRKAIGASRGVIMLQFLIEALMLSLLGCLLGLALSAAVLAAVSLLVDGVTFLMEPTVVGVAIGFSLAIGLLFGLYPANKAARKPPIEALRYGE